MAIQTIGGAAASTALSGTPILKLQRATPGMQGISVSNSEKYVENVLSTPLPSGNYFFTLTRSTSYTNGGTQVIIQLNDNTILGAVGAYSGTQTSSQGFFIPAGKTATKIIFRKPINISWDETIDLSVVASTDAVNFYGHSLSTSGRFNLPALPAGYVKVTDTYYSQGQNSLSKDGTKHYFVAMVSTRKDLVVSGNNAFPNASETINSNLKFFEYNLVNGTLTERAAPAVINGNINVGWNPGTASPQSWSSCYLYHFYRATCHVGNNVIYFDPSYAYGVGYGANTYNMDFFYPHMGSYNISSNTWTQIQSGAGWGTGWRNHSTGISGDNLVHANYIIRSGYSTANQLNFYISYTNSFNTDGRVYRSGTGWGNYYTGASTSAWSWSEPGGPLVANDRYCLVDANYNSTNQSWSNISCRWVDTTTLSMGFFYAAGIPDPLNSNQGYSVSGNSVSKQNQYFKDTTSTSHIYMAIGESGILYRVNLSALCGAGNGANMSSYSTRTKWLVSNSGADSSGLIYIVSLDRLWQTGQGFYVGSSAANTSFSVGSEITPIPTDLFNAGY